jgi:hypothetical protein
MKQHRLVILAILVLIASIVCLGLSDREASVADTSIPGGELASSVSQTEDARPVTSVITITMYTVTEE